MNAPNPAAGLLRRIDDLPATTWVRCGRCRGVLYRAKLDRNLGVCPECGFHLRLALPDRLDVLFDPGSFAELDSGLASADPLGFADTKPYSDRLRAARERTGRTDAAVYGTATVGGHPVVAVVLDFAFMGGSMGAVVGEKVARAAELAALRQVPLISCSSSGGARMQEGIFSLLQMAKTAAAIRLLGEAGQPHISVLTDPVYGGVSASMASLADVIIAEDDTRAGFAGPQVIAQTLRQTLPDGFQTARFLLEHGHIDAVVARGELRAAIGRVVTVHDAARRHRTPGSAEALPSRAEPATAAVDPWDRVRLARHPQRPVADDYLTGVFDGLFELRGDRQSSDDPAMFGGLGLLDGAPVVVVAHRKGRGTAQAVARNFGMPVPAGYRKARRLMEYAERFALPLVMLIDTPGAYPGVSAEQANQSGAIAANLSVLAGLRTAVLAVVVGEGGSGGALAIGVADRLLMLENALLSVISPEGCATILFGTASAADRAARALRLTAPDLAELGVVNEIVPEPPGGAHADPAAAVAAVGAAVRRHLGALAAQDPDVLVKTRLERLRAAGPVIEAPPRPERRPTGGQTDAGQQH